FRRDVLQLAKYCLPFELTHIDLYFGKNVSRIGASFLGLRARASIIFFSSARSACPVTGEAMGDADQCV
ncbi:MAG TPA: hypothetical protein VEZ40_04670, partial [Pyrinomonadaceae bacterium]|nr:hypothetical protein [Pyrinomonadaceae bacterium]